jgi:hypothetical protein
VHRATRLRIAGALLIACAAIATGPAGASAARHKPVIDSSGVHITLPSPDKLLPCQTGGGLLSDYCLPGVSKRPGHRKRPRHRKHPVRHKIRHRGTHKHPSPARQRRRKR